MSGNGYALQIIYNLLIYNLWVINLNKTHFWYLRVLISRVLERLFLRFVLGSSLVRPWSFTRRRSGRYKGKES